MNPYPKPATPLPWLAVTGATGKDATYIIRAANSFPHLVAALERVQACHVLGNYPGTRVVLDRALAIARGEVMP